MMKACFLDSDLGSRLNLLTNTHMDRLRFWMISSSLRFLCSILLISNISNLTCSFCTCVYYVLCSPSMPFNAFLFIVSKDHAKSNSLGQKQFGQSMERLKR